MSLSKTEFTVFSPSFYQTSSPAVSLLLSEWKHSLYKGQSHKWGHHIGVLPLLHLLYPILSILPEPPNASTSAHRQCHHLSSCHRCPSSGCHLVSPLHCWISPNWLSCHISNYVFIQHLKSSFYNRSDHIALLVRTLQRLSIALRIKSKLLNREGSSGSGPSLPWEARFPTTSCRASRCSTPVIKGSFWISRCASRLWCVSLLPSHSFPPPAQPDLCLDSCSYVPPVPLAVTPIDGVGCSP